MVPTDASTPCAVRILLLLLLVAAASACGNYDGRPDNAAPPTMPGGATPSPAPQTDTEPIDLVRGQALYQDLCARCHGPEGRGGGGWPSLSDASCLSCGDYEDLWRTIEATMPWRASNQCGRACARNIAAWIINGFSTVPSCAVAFEYTQIAMQQFSATVRIANRRGLDVETWTLAWTPDVGQRVAAAEGATVERRTDDLLLTPTAENARIADGSEVTVVIQGEHEGMNAIPDDLRLEAPPCFAAAPATE